MLNIYKRIGRFVFYAGSYSVFACIGITFDRMNSIQAGYTQQYCFAISLWFWRISFSVNI